MLAMYLAYRLFLARDNQHGFNRGVLLGIYVVSFLALPAMSLSENPASQSTAMTLSVNESGWTDVIPATHSEPVWGTILIWIFLAGMIVVTVRTVIVWAKLLAVIRSGEKIIRNGYTLVVTEDERYAPFSWMNYMVISRKDYENNCSAIAAHELKHIVARHWIDLLIAQAVCIIGWFNPAAWLMRDELMLIHEYQADIAVIEKGHDPQEYQMLLIKKAVGARFPSLANSLNHSKLKKRITMMYNQNSSASRRLRGLALVPALAAAIAITDVEAVASVIDDVSSAEMGLPSGNDPVRTAPIISDNAVVAAVESADIVSGQSVETAGADSESSGRKDSENSGITQSESLPAPQEAPAAVSDEPQKQQTVSADNMPDNAVFFECEQKPEFPGGDVALMKYISENIRYPKNAHDNRIEGRVVISFVIQKDGTIGKTKIVRSADPELDAEAERVVRSLPAFTPGEMNGKVVAVWYTIPITFKLKGMDTGKKDDGLSSRPAAMLVNGRPVIIVEGEKVNIDVYVDGKLFDGRLDDLDPNTIQEMRVEKGAGDKKDAVYITLKK